MATDRRLNALIPQTLLDFDSAAAEALEADRQHVVPARWVEGSIACRGFRPQYSYYAKQAEGHCSTTAPAHSVWAEVCRFGVDGDFFYSRSLWWIRRAMDWLVGGPSFRRRRRHPDQLRVGDVVDAWRVIAIEPGARLTLLMEMKAPGSGVLEFTVQDKGPERKISMHAYWHPAGVWGLLYWYSTLPVHRLLFRGSVAGIASRAESPDTFPP